MDVHRVSPVAFGRFCAGAVNPQVVALLRRAQYSKRRLLLAALVDAMAAEPAWRLLTEADEAAPAVVEDVLMAPSTGTWLARALAEPSERGYLHSVAVAVAIRAGLPCELPVPVVRGVITLPTVGRLHVDDAIGTMPGEEVQGMVALPSASFVPVHRHGDLVIDDSTPYRRFQAPEDPHPLTPGELTAWQEQLDEAWQLLTRWHPGFAEELSAGITTVVPIPRPTRLVGASAGMAFGAAAMAKPATAADLAAVLVHEFQHSKMNAMLDLLILHTRPEDALVYAPWRDDPRPLTGLLHGIYAFTSNVEFWYVQSQKTGARNADFEYAHRNLQVSAAVGSLADADDLTELGRTLVDSAARRLAACPLDDLPADLRALLETTIVDHRATWRICHVHPNEPRIQALLRAWREGGTSPEFSYVPLAVEPGRRTVRHARTRLLRSRATGRPTAPGSGADVAFADGRVDEASDGYVARLRNAPGDAGAWVGLGLALLAAGETEPARAILETPEVTLSVFEQIRADPLEFARWLSQ